MSFGDVAPVSTTASLDRPGPLSSGRRGAGEVRLDDRRLALLFLREVLATRGPELLGGVAALLDERG
jgi:hypothetical protein